MKCIEAHILTWTSNTYCPLQNVVSVMQQHRDRFYSHFNYVDAFKLGGFMLCLGKYYFCIISFEKLNMPEPTIQWLNCNLLLKSDYS